MRNVFAYRAPMAALVLVCAVSACGSTETPRDPSVDRGSSPDAAAHTADAGSTGSADAGGGTKSDGGELIAPDGGGRDDGLGNTGVVVVAHAGNPPKAAFHLAQFYGGDEPNGVTCSGRSEGACLVTSCLRPDGGTGEPGFVSAGDVTISGGTGAPIVLAPDATGAYTPRIQPPSRWSAGDMVSVSAAGTDAGVPAFSGSITFPPAIEVLTPAAPAPGQKLHVPRTSDFIATWTSTGTADGVVNLSINQQQTSPAGVARVNLFCVFPVTAQQGSIPQAALMALQPGVAELGVVANNTQEAQAGAWQVRMVAASDGRNELVEVVDLE